MEKKFKYKLDKSAKKFVCPECGKKTFVLYVDEKGKYANEKFGRCDREMNCGHINIPKEDGTSTIYTGTKEEINLQPSFIDLLDVDSTLQDYSKNSFCIWLNDLVGEEKIIRAISDYRFGIDNTVTTDKNWVIFWQYDINGNVRSGKIIRYLNNGRRDKNVNATWYHACNKKRYEDFNLVQCFFGERQLFENPRKAVAVVESEKTAIIASCFMDNYIWLSCGGLTQLSEKKCEVLRNRNVTLFPDTGSIGRNGDFYLDKQTSVIWIKENGEWNKTTSKTEHWDESLPKNKYRTGNGKPKSSFNIWKEIARKYSWNCSDILEKKATNEEKSLGYDIADYLVSI